MTSVQLNTMNTELWQSIGAIADNESLMRRLTRYAKRLVKEQENDPTLMTKEEFFARVEEAKKGPSYELKEGETIEDLIKRLG
ncbi:MAG: hypothetical protein K6C07_04155 [Bacteroidales bacterium]|nr:hypothetical protein [Bacteroidales bacterium]MCR5190578.1 hypothetical protein [Bacteroidales bacterium]